MPDTDCDFRFDYDGFDKAMATIALIVCLPCVWFMILNGAVGWLFGFTMSALWLTMLVALVVPCIAVTVEMHCSQWSRVCDTMSRMDWTEDMDDTKNQTDR